MFVSVIYAFLINWPEWTNQVMISYKYISQTLNLFINIRVVHMINGTVLGTTSVTASHILIHEEVKGSRETLP